MQAISGWEKVTVEQFKNEIVPQNKPVILKSLMGDWSVVKAAKESSRAFADYIKSHDRKKEVLALGSIRKRQLKVGKLELPFFRGGPKRGNPTMTTSTVTARRKGDPQH